MSYTNQKDFIGLSLSLPGLRCFHSGAINSSGDLVDISGNGRDMTLTGNPEIDEGAEGAFSYFDYDGTGDYHYRADEAGLDIRGNESYVTNKGLTNFCWYNPQSSNDGGIIAKWNSGRSWLMQSTSSDDFVLAMDDGSSLNVNQWGSYTVGEWHFCLMRFIPSTEFAFFLNGTWYTDSSVGSAINNTGAQYRIGSHDTNSQDGRISNVGLYASALSDDHVDRLWEAGRVLYGV